MTALAPATVGGIVGQQYSQMVQPFGTSLAQAQTQVTQEQAQAAASATSAQIVETAKKYLGVPYKWGGTDPAKGLDCSGFVQLVFKDLGVDLPRVSWDQAKSGEPVESLDKALPGDIIFYRSSGSPSGGHIGIYVGDGQMIQAPKSGDVVRIKPIPEGKELTIRRIIPQAAPAAAAAYSIAPAFISGTSVGSPTSVASAMPAQDAVTARMLSALYAGTA